MKEQELLYVLALSSAKGIGDALAKKLLLTCGSAEAIFSEKKQLLSKIEGCSQALLSTLQDPNNFKKAAQEIAYISKNQIKACHFQEESYPSYLKHCYDGPLVFFQKGNLNLKDQKIISIVGSRQMTSYGRSVLEELFEDIKEYNPVIVSGLAYGVDIYSHRLALKHKLQTVAVLAHGLDILYPPIHKNYAKKMQQNGGLISEFWSGTPPEPRNFVKRNRIVAGLSKATIVIESAIKGGSLITADIANSYNRDVFAIPGRINDPYSKGCNHLIKINKAAVLTSAKDLAYILNWEKDAKATQVIQKQLFVTLDPPEKGLYNYLQKEGKQQLDLIALHCKQPIFKTAAMLLQLELKGVVRPLPGKFFELA